MKLRIVLFFIALVFIEGCKHDEFDAKYYAKKYCDCVTYNRDKLGMNFFDSRTQCDGLLLAENKYFRAWYNDIYHRRYLIFQPSTFTDSVKVFNSEFIHYAEKNCCKDAYEGCDTTDFFQRNRKLMDTTKVRY